MNRPISIWEKLGYGVMFVVVAGAAFRVSYTHIRDLALWTGQPVDVASILPLAVDGMMGIAALALRADRVANRRPRGWAIFGMWLGGGVSVAANVGITVVHRGWDWLAIGVAAAAPIFLVVSIEIVSHVGKPRKTAQAVEVKADDAMSPNLPEAPVSPAPPTEDAVEPAPAGKVGRPSIPAKKGPATPRIPEGKMVHAETGEPLPARTEYRKRKLAGAAG